MALWYLAENPAAGYRSHLCTSPVGCCEPREQAGLAHLLAAVLTEGTPELSSLEIAEQVESVGAA